MLAKEARKIAEEAKRKGMWLYDPKYKKWDSPEDLKHIFHYANAGEELLKGLHIRHPSEGIQAGFKRLMDVTNICHFLGSLNSYETFRFQSCIHGAIGRANCIRKSCYGKVVFAAIILCIIPQ